MFKRNSQEIENTLYSSVIRVIGYKDSGKTTFMAALARWPNASANSPVQSVTANNDAGKNLILKAQNILEAGDIFEVTTLENDAEMLDDYSISIKLKDKFSWRNPQLNGNNRIIDLNISCKDYAGEFFVDLLQSGNNDARLRSYLEDCTKASGIALLVDGYSHRMDSEYAIVLDKFLQELDRSETETQYRRIALILTKAEYGEIFTTRNDSPSTTVSQRFPQVYKRLEAWQNSKAGKVNYFRASAFGTLGNRSPEPNSKITSRTAKGTIAAIRNPRLWKPFGLVSPLYWLCTGERHPDLDKD
jgi:adenylate kinase family enzyme